MTSGTLNESQKRTKRAALIDADDVERAGEHARLIADDADRVPVEPREAADDVLGVVLHHLEEPPVVDDAA